MLWLHRGVPGDVCSRFGAEGAPPVHCRWWCRADVILPPGREPGMEGEHAAGSRPALLQEGFCFAKQPRLRKSCADKSHLFVPGPGTGGELKTLWHWLQRVG